MIQQVDQAVKRKQLSDTTSHLIFRARYDFVECFRTHEKPVFFCYLLEVAGLTALEIGFIKNDVRKPIHVV